MQELIPSRACATRKRIRDRGIDLRLLHDISYSGITYKVQKLEDKRSMLRETLKHRFLPCWLTGCSDLVIACRPSTRIINYDISQRLTTEREPFVLVSLSTYLWNQGSEVVRGPKSKGPECVATPARQEKNVTL